MKLAAEKNDEIETARLLRCEQADFFFLARQGKSWLFDLPSVYTQGSPANLVWIYGKCFPHTPVTAMFLHVDKAVEGIPWGSVTILNYRDSVADVEMFSTLPQAQRERHIRLLIRRYLRSPRHCSMLEVIHYLKRGENQWT